MDGRTREAKTIKMLRFIVKQIILFGDVLLIANKGTGKTNTLMVLTRYFRLLDDIPTKVIVFEDFPKWCMEFDAIPFWKIRDETVTQTSETIDMENYFLRHERDYTVLNGTEIKQLLKDTDDLIFVSEIDDMERQAFFIYSVVRYFYKKHYFRAYHKVKKRERVIFVVEEAQNVFDSSVVSRKLFLRLRKIYAVARNLDLHFVLASQRLQDLNTKIRGRARLMIGNINQDDYELKIRKLLRHSKYLTKVLTFERGEFVYLPVDTKVKFPLFKQEGEPYEVTFW